MHKIMVEFSHNSLIAMDSTFNTIKYGYQLYTLMVFNKKQNGLPIAWVISSRDRTFDINECLSALIEEGIKEHQD
eukprot:Gb_14955 [translate_table: standard]